MLEEDAIGRALAAEYERDDAFDPTRYIPPGPVAQAFINDRSMSPFIMGPVGGGKTTAAIFKRIKAATMMPACRDGTIRDRWVVVRSTYRDAEKTILASWQQSFPKGYPGSTWSGGNDRPAIHTLRFRQINPLTREECVVEAETHFIGLNGERIEVKLRGWEISGALLNEADQHDEGALRYLEQRTGRYPRKRDLPDGVEPFRQVIGDLNAPDLDNWIYKHFVEERRAGRNLHVQPSGRSAEAENRINLPKGYYEQMVASEPDWYVRRFVDNEFGYSREGKPVYEEFNARVHVAGEEIPVDQNLPLLIGMDAGLTPAGVLLQPTPDGQLRGVGEVVPGHGFGAGRFGELLNEYVAARFPRVPSIRDWCDPAAQYGADREGGELAWMDTVSLAIGRPIQLPAGGSNELGLRLDAVRRELRSTLDGRRPRLIYCPKHCPMLIRGFASKYRYRKRAAGAATDYEIVPEKNEYSHPHDGNQYVILGYRGRNAVVSAGRPIGVDRAADRAEMRNQLPANTPWNTGQRGGFDVHNLGGGGRGWR